MISRARVNYGWLDLFGALAAGRSDRWRKALQAELSRRMESEHILLAPSGRGAFYLLLLALPHKRVLVPAYTCKAVIEAAELAGKIVVHVDGEPGDLNLAATGLEPHCDADTIIVATHQFGIPCDIEGYVALARRTGAFLVEDAAASFGTRVDGQLTGRFGDAAFFSFDSTKLVNVPLKAGFLLLRSAELRDRCAAVLERETKPMPLAAALRYLAFGAALLAIQQPMLYRLFHWLKFGRSTRFTDEDQPMKTSPGDFYRYDVPEWQAKIALRQVRALEATIDTRRDLYRRYREALAPATSMILPPEDASAEWAPVRFPIRVPRKLDFYRAGVERGVDFAFSFTFLAAPEDHVHAHAIADTILDLPFYPGLTDREFGHIVTTLLDMDRQHGIESGA